MPVSNASRVLRRPRFAQRVTVIRRSQTVGDDGRGVITETTLTPIGVITAGSVQPLVQVEDSTHARNNITVHCVERLLDPTAGHQPDIILYQGNRYVVTKTYDWSTYGAGFYAAEADLQDLVSAS